MSTAASRSDPPPPPVRSGLALRHVLLAVGLVAATAAILLGDGPRADLRLRTVKLWHGVVESSENSQHISDWYRSPI